MKENMQTLDGMFVRLSYSNPEGTSISAQRKDGSIRGIQPIDTELWELAVSGIFGVVEPYIPPPGPTLEELVLSALDMIDRKTGDFRRQFITDISGQQMTYLRKKEVAIQFLSETDPDPEQYPRIMAAVGVVADNPRSVAETWAAKAAEWEQLDILIESRRESFKKQASEASSKEELEAVLNEFKNWSA